MSVENLKKFALKLGQTQNFIVSATMDIIENDSFKKKVVEYNKGMLSDGYGSVAKLGEYTPKAKEMRADMGYQTEFIDLKQKGDFHNSIFVESAKMSATTPAIIIDAKDYKWRSKVSGNREKPDSLKSLQERYPDALGINERDMPEFGGYIAPLLAQRISNFWKI